MENNIINIVIDVEVKHNVDSVTLDLIDKKVEKIENQV